MCVCVCIYSHMTDELHIDMHDKLTCSDMFIPETSYNHWVAS